MPIDDAINMMTVSYEAYMDQLLAKKSKTNPPTERTAYLLRVGISNICESNHLCLLFDDI